MKKKGRQRSTFKRDVFVLEYLKDFNGARAARAAGAPARSARERAYEMLRDPDLQAELKRRASDVCSKLGVSLESVVGRLLVLATSDVGQVAQWDSDRVSLKASKSLTADQLYAVAEVRDIFGSDGRHGQAVKQHDKLGALALLAKIVGLVVEKHEHTGKDGAPLPATGAVVHYHYPGAGRVKPKADGG